MFLQLEDIFFKMKINEYKPIKSMKALRDWYEVLHSRLVVCTYFNIIWRTWMRTHYFIKLLYRIEKNRVLNRMSKHLHYFQRHKCAKKARFLVSSEYMNTQKKWRLFRLNWIPVMSWPSSDVWENVQVKGRIWRSALTHLRTASVFWRLINVNTAFTETESVCVCFNL